MTWRDRFALWQARFVKKPMLWSLRWAPLLRPVFAVSVRVEGSGPRSVSCLRSDLGDRPSLRFKPQTPGRGVVLYLHGGGFVMGGLVSYRPLAARLAAASGLTVYLPDYRLAPEHPFPAATDDALAEYKTLLERHSGSEIAIAGDSAGGCLALSLLHQIATEGLESPAAMVLLSPVGDLSPQARARLETLGPDQILPKAWARWASNAYLGDNDGSHPLVSPLVQAFTQAPPTLIQCAKGEVLGEDADRAAAALRAAGASVALTRFAGAYHAFQIGRHPMAEQAVAEIGQFLHDKLAE